MCVCVCVFVCVCVYANRRCDFSPRCGKLVRRADNISWRRFFKGVGLSLIVFEKGEENVGLRWCYLVDDRG